MIDNHEKMIPTSSRQFMTGACSIAGDDKTMSMLDQKIVVRNSTAKVHVVSI